MVINDSDCQRVYTRNAAAEFYFFIRGLGAWPLPLLPSGLSKRSGERRELPEQSPGRQSIFGLFEVHRTAHKTLNFSQKTTQSID